MNTILTRLDQSCYADGMKKLALLVLFAIFVVFPLAAEDAEFYFNRGVEYHNRDELDLAIEDYTTAIDLNPGYADAWNRRGNACCELGEWDLAIADYSKAITIDPCFAIYRYNLGIAYREKGEIDRAIEELNEAIVLDPDYSAAWNMRGVSSMLSLMNIPVSS